MSKHTPGPWNIDGGTNSNEDLFIWKTGEYYSGHAIATVHGEIQEGSQANARLIAAAPDLLEALVMAKRLINANTLLDAGNPANIKIEAAIAKAIQ